MAIDLATCLGSNNCLFASLSTFSMEWDVDVAGPTSYVHVARRVTKHDPAVIGNRTEHRCARHDRRRVVGHRLSRRSRIWEARNCVESVSKAAAEPS